MFKNMGGKRRCQGNKNSRWRTRNPGVSYSNSSLRLTTLTNLVKVPINELWRLCPNSYLGRHLPEMRRKYEYKLQSTWNNWFKHVLADTYNYYSGYFLFGVQCNLARIQPWEVKFHIWGDVGKIYDTRSFIFLLWLFPTAFMWSKFCGMLATIHLFSHRVCACGIW